MRAYIYRKDGTFLRTEERTPECGEDFCDRCGDCLHCYDRAVCMDDGDGGCWWAVYEDAETGGGAMSDYTQAEREADNEERRQQAEGREEWITLPYERINPEALAQAIRLAPGERLLVRRPWRWHIDGQMIPNAYEMFDRDGLCREKGWEVVCDFGEHIAIVREATR